MTDELNNQSLFSPGSTSALVELFDALPHVMFCMKGADDRYLAVNDAFVRRSGRASKREVIGARAVDLFPRELAERYEEQDAHVLATGEPLRVADLAEAAGCSEKQLERRMKKVFGLSATQYVLRVRVDRATSLLLNSAEPIASVAVSCGFYDQASFTRQFGRLAGETPARFRALSA